MRFTLLFTILLLYIHLSSQEVKLNSLFDKLYLLDSVRITLTYPFDSLSKTNNDEIDALISIETDSGSLMTNEPLKLTLRGKFRRMKCSFPPILLNFKKSTLKRMNLDNVDAIKLVTHCIDGPEGQANLQEERMLYQIYESVTPLSYRTIWLNVSYCDMSHPGVCMSSTAFLIEPDKVISTRLGVVEKKVYSVLQDSLQYESYGHTVAFNFMIGNRDWSVHGSRNAKLFYDPTQGKYIVIPYDFDYSNVVGPSYRRENLPENMIHPYDRIYQGEYFENKSGDILKSFAANQDTIIKTIDKSLNPMDTERRQQIERYIQSWFKMVNRLKANELNYGIVLPYKGGL